MTLAEFVDYCLTISAQVAAEPAASPILDAQMAIEFFLPAVFREITREAYASNTYLHTLIKTHGIEINRGFGTLPTGLEEQFVESFQVGRIRPVFVRSIIAPVSKEALSDGIAADVGNGNFDQLVDTGFIIAVELNSVELVRATIEEVADNDTVTVRDYTVGGNVTGVVNLLASAKIYEPQYVLNRTVAVHKEAGEEIGGDNAGELLATDADIGGLITVEVAGSIVLRAIITSIVNEDTLAIVGYSGAIISPATGTGRIYHIAEAAEAEDGHFTPENLGLFSWCQHYGDYLRDTADILPKFCVRDQKIFAKDADDEDFEDGTGIVVIGVTVPQVPAAEDDEIEVGEQFLDDALMLSAAIIRGDRPLESIGLSAEMMTKKRRPA